MATTTQPRAGSKRARRPPAGGGFRRLLVATDFSPTSQRALLFAGRLLAPDGHLRLLHAIEGHPWSPAGLLTPVRARTTTTLERLAAEVSQRGIACSRRVALGEPHLEIPREAERFGADAIVCGTRGRRGLPRFFLGSVAEHLFHTARLPLLVVPPVPIGRSIRRVLLATDFSPASGAALDLLERLARPGDWEVTIQHVLEPDFSFAFGAGPGTWREMKRRGVAAAEGLKEIGARLRRAGVKAAERLDAGDAVLRIVRCAREEGTDLLVLGTRGRSGPAKLFFGSVSSKVVRASPCPLLVVPGPARRGGAL
ncbi:MAG: universal stress protein [Planctomycetes bacterium]|nr:universal stress protein [Planctomycetota bacterium]